MADAPLPLWYRGPKASHGKVNGGKGHSGTCPSGGAGGAGCGGNRPYRVVLGRKYRCWRCGSGWHFKQDCSNDPESCGAEAADVSCTFNHGYNRVVTLAQQGKISPSSNLILLNSCYTCYVCNDSSLLHDVQHFKEHMISQGLCIMSNGRMLDCDQVGHIGKLSFPVWYNGNSIANILSILKVSQDQCLTLDTSMENSFWLHCDDGQIL